MNLDIYPINGTNKEKCIHQWLWIQEHCECENIYDAKDNYNENFPENNDEDCWACEEANTRSMLNNMNKICYFCPVTWFIGQKSTDAASCIDTRSPYEILHGLEERVTKDNAQRVIDIIRNTWNE